LFSWSTAASSGQAEVVHLISAANWEKCKHQQVKEMVLLTDEVNKIVWICPHKCGLNTITTYLMRLYGHEDAGPSYYVSELRAMGFCNYEEKYKSTSYMKILLIRNPYERFVSGFLQDLERDNFLPESMTFAQFCDFLFDIYDKENVPNFTDFRRSNSEDPNLLRSHLKPLNVDIRKELLFFEEKFDMIVNTRDLDKVLLSLHSLYPRFPYVKPANQKYYGSKDSVVDFTLREIKAKGKSPGGYPHYQFFYNDTVKAMVECMYRYDFSLIRRLMPELMDGEWP